MTRENPRRPADTLYALMVRRATLGAAVALAALTLAAGVTAHRQLHEATDAMLAELAASEAKLALAEPGPLHVHGSVIQLPGLDAAPTERHAVALDAACRVLAVTPTLGDALAGDPAPLCQPDTVQAARAFFVSAGGLELRAASASAYGPDGEQLRVVVGVDHHLIDHAVFRLVALVLAASALTLAAVWLTTRAAARSVTAELERLREYTARLDVGGPDAGPLPPPPPPSARASAEVLALTDALGELGERASRAARLQARFVAEAAHELRTPVAAIRGEIEVTLRRERDAEDYRASLAALAHDAARLERLVDALLDATRAAEAPLPTSPTPLDGPFAGAVAMLGAELDGLEVHADLAGAPAVLAHEPSLERVLINLVSNAARHSGATRVTARARRVGDHVELEITDDGRGVPDDLREHLFAPFQRGSDRRGHGLGLHLAARLARAQGGGLELDPDHAPGARFVLTLPAA